MNASLASLLVVTLGCISLQVTLGAGANNSELQLAGAGLETSALPGQSNAYHQRTGLQCKLPLQGLTDTGPPAAPAAAAALSDDPPLATCGTDRQLLESCADRPDDIICNSEPLCSAVGLWRGGSTTPEMGTECDCIRMCELALQRGGQCNKELNPATGSYYYRMQYDGSVECHPKGGGGGRKG